MADISSITVTNVARTVFGNKRIIIADLTMGDGSSTWPTAGVELLPSDLGLRGIDFLAFQGGTLVYKYDATNKLVHAYTAPSTTGADKLLVVATSAIPNETVRCIAIGYGVDSASSVEEGS